jgi:hypothetical protein
MAGQMKGVFVLLVAALVLSPVMVRGVLVHEVPGLR